MRTTTSRALAAGVSAAILAFTVGACSPQEGAEPDASVATDGPDGEQEEQSQEPRPEPQAPDPGEGAWPTTDSIGNPDLGSEARLIPTAVQYECDSEADAATASGTLRNTDEDARDLLITMLWVSDEGEILATATQTFAEVPGGESVEFSVEGTLDQDASGCNFKAQSAPTGTLEG